METSENQKITKLLKLGSTVLLLVIPWVIAIIYMQQNNSLEITPMEKTELESKRISSVDHSKLEALKREFETPQQVTKACISCHTERHKEVMQTAHWLWEREEYIEGRGVVYAGKKNLLNNFCIGIAGSELSCTKCHAGYGWHNNTFDFTVADNVDCMVCHDNSNTYIKASGKAGYPPDTLNLGKVARNVGLPVRDNCGMCHFFGGGGNNVKHGDLEIGIIGCERDVDIHISPEGNDMHCIDCHTAENHKMRGKLYTVSSMNRQRATCEQCHGEHPHNKALINEHTIKVSCQTCHIPIYAKVNATKLTWDWSKAGRMKDGKPYTEKDKDGNITYKTIKGEFTWGKNLQPEYVWFNGTADHYIIGDKVDTTEIIKINTLHGNYTDENSKIIPVKVHRSKQIYDCTRKVIIQPKLYAEEKGRGAYWKDFDWSIAAKMGMELVGQSFSGKYCFVRTEMYWPLNHMVAPKEQVVTCSECHTRNHGRLQAWHDFYMPGRNYNATLDNAGWLLVILSVACVLMHGTIRIITHRLRKQKD